jgi:hypothetical protein
MPNANGWEEFWGRNLVAPTKPIHRWIDNHACLFTLCGQVVAGHNYVDNMAHVYPDWTPTAEDCCKRCLEETNDHSNPLQAGNRTGSGK